MENLDILQFIKKSFAEKNLFSFFLISIVSFALILFIGGAFIGGFYLGIYTEKQESPASSYGEVKNRDAAIPKFLSKDVDFRLFWDVWSRVRSDFIDVQFGIRRIFDMSALMAGHQSPMGSRHRQKNIFVADNVDLATEIITDIDSDFFR